VGGKAGGPPVPVTFVEVAGAAARDDTAAGREGRG
jgi:hypothetical protein